MKSDLITIGISCYNAEGTIVPAVRSALNQEWENLEVVVVDDRSTDSSRELVETIARTDQRVRLIRHEVNTGVGGARKTIVDASKGVFVTFFDDDDQSDRHRVATQRKRILNYEAATGQKLVACYASGQRRYLNGYVRQLPAIGSQPEIPVGRQVVDYLLFNERDPDGFYGSGTPACALMARRATIESAGNFDPSFRRVEDSDFAIRLAYLGAHFIGCPEKLYTQTATSGMDKSPEANLRAELHLLEKHKPYLDTKGLYGYARQWFYFRFYHFNGDKQKAFFAIMRSWWANPFRTTRHLLRSAPRRFFHEYRMRQG